MQLALPPRLRIDLLKNVGGTADVIDVYCDEVATLRSMILAHVEPSAANILPFRHLTPKSGEHFRTCVATHHAPCRRGEFASSARHGAARAKAAACLCGTRVE